MHVLYDFGCAYVPRTELAGYQFPVEEDDEQSPKHQPPNLSKQPTASALKKTSHDSPVNSFRASRVSIVSCFHIQLRN